MRIFATRVWGFDPERWPVIVFGREGDRDSLTRRSQPGDRIVLVATMDPEKVESENRGRLLGIAEFGRVSVRTEDFVRREDMSPHDLDERGQVRWQHALPIVRAWRLPQKPKVLDVLRAQLPYNATSQAVLLDDADTASILALATEEAELPTFDKMVLSRALVDGLAGQKGPTSGPRPSSSTYEVTRDAHQPASTYCFRFGQRDIWKIGWARDVAHRLREVNLHVPTEVLHESWNVQLHHRWPDDFGAQAMEQRVLEALARFRTNGERVQCSPKELQRAWALAIGG